MGAFMSDLTLDVLQHKANITGHPEISVVIPLLNEVENVQPLYTALKSTMQKMKRPWEVVFVDDGSTDGTYELLKKLHGNDECMCVVKLRRNFGQTAAMTAGFDHAQGEIIVCLDGDLQNDPQDIPQLVNKLGEGYDVVSGWRANRQDGFWLRTLPSRIAKLADQPNNGDLPARLRLHSQGIPSGHDSRAAIVWRDAPVHSCFNCREWRSYNRNPRESLCQAPWKVQIWDFSYCACHFGSVDSEIFALFSYQTFADFWTNRPFIVFDWHNYLLLSYSDEDLRGL
jgi:glycosyltransferase involved in cell wall biosynthesis